MKEVLAMVALIAVLTLGFAYPTFFGYILGLGIVGILLYGLFESIYDRFWNPIQKEPKADWINQQKENYI